MTNYELIRTRRRTVAIYVKEGRLIVRAPQRVPKREIDRFILSKQDWIEKRLMAQRACAEQRAAFSLTYGSPVLFRGYAYRIASSGSFPVCERRDGSLGSQRPSLPELLFPPGLNEAQLRQKIILFYKEQARKILPERIAVFAPLMGVRPDSIRIGSAKRSWGSCNAAGRIIFSWRLMMADPDAIDYVVVHELAHLKQLNHSVAFWSVVAQTMPDWKKRRQKLRQLQERLSTEDWE